MWGLGLSESLARIQNGLSVNPEAAAEAKAKRKAEKKIEKAGYGECNFCKEVIIKNNALNGVWESEFLVGYCPDIRDHMHKPMIDWRIDE